MNLSVRRIAPGRAEGVALVARVPFSFVGGSDPMTGEVLDEASGVRGERLGRRAFAFPHGKGSTVGSYTIYGLAKRGLGPSAILMERADGIVAVGAVLAGIPMVDRVDLGALLTGDRLSVDADGGRVDLPDVDSRDVVTVFVRNRGRLLIVRRSEAVGSFQGKWSGISGYLEGREDPEDRARKEVSEETGIRDARLVAAGVPVISRDRGTAYVVRPFLFDVSTRRVRLDWENVESRWIRIDEIDAFDAVPRLEDVMRSALAGQEVRKG